MARVDNYAIQAAQAKQRFLTYDQQTLAEKLKLPMDAEWMYTAMLGEPCRIRRSSGDVQRMFRGQWIPADSFGEVMTLLDLVCDSRPERYVSGRWKNMTAFGHMFHKDLLEQQKDPWAEAFAEDPAGFRRACEALGGEPFPQGDIAYEIEVFDGLPLVIQLWLGDEEFPAGIRLLWDENARMYIKYETMHYARDLLLKRIREYMQTAETE